MGDKPWKKFERACGALIDGKRYTANQGGRIDVEGEAALGQCKEVGQLSLEQLTQLAEEMSEAGRQRKKLGLVFAKVRRGSGYKSPTLVVMTEDQWRVVWAGIQMIRRGGHCDLSHQQPTQPMDGGQRALPDCRTGSGDAAA